MDYDHDGSDVEKRFGIDYNQKMSLDDRRARMYIINQLMAARD